MRQIMYNNEVIARNITSQDWKDGLSFFSKDEQFVQVGAWNYSFGKGLQQHIHNEIERTINRTQQVLYIVKGSILAKLYSLEEQFIQRFLVKQGDVLILLNCGHGYQIMADDTKVLQIKNGPYLGAEIDRRRFNG